MRFYEKLFEALSLCLSFFLWLRKQLKCIRYTINIQGVKQLDFNTQLWTVCTFQNIHWWLKLKKRSVCGTDVTFMISFLEQKLQSKQNILVFQWYARMYYFCYLLFIWDNPSRWRQKLKEWNSKLKFCMILFAAIKNSKGLTP